MAERKRIGLLFESYNTLPAYVIYVMNMVRTLNMVDDAKKPLLVILHRPDSPLAELKALNYPYMRYYQLQDIYRQPLKRVINKVWRAVFKKNLLPFIDSGFPQDLDCLFPYGERPEALYVKHKIIWKPDFQEYHLPIYVSKHELYENHELLKDLSTKGIHLVLSSQDAERDFNRYFPGHNAKISLLKFTSFLPDFSKQSIIDLKKTHKIQKPYFIVSNQFWPHKNHLTVLKALYRNKQNGSELNYQLVFTGKTTSNRDPELFDKLRFYIEQHSLANDVVFTGFISREEQLCLMQHALAVIQPSLFEGWSTVIEDAKALNQRLIVSSLSVHKEQLHSNVSFFSPFDFAALGEYMTRYSDAHTIPPLEKVNYNNNILEYKKQLELVFEL